MALEMMKGGLFNLGKTALDWVSITHCIGISNRLKKYSIWYEDLYDQTDSIDIQEALNRLPSEVMDARNQCIKCAMDLPKELQIASRFLKLDRITADLFGDDNMKASRSVRHIALPYFYSTRADVIPNG